MNRIVAAVAAVFMLVLGAGGMSQAVAAGSVDGGLIFATEPAPGFDSTIGIGVGGTFDVSDKAAAKDMKIGVRADLSYFDWDNGAFGVGLSYKRLMLFGGPRLSFSTGPKSAVTPYVEGGLELSFDEAEAWIPGLGIKVSANDTNIGLAAGGGVEIAVSDRAKFGIGARLHLITDDFLSLAFTFGVGF